MTPSFTIRTTAKELNSTYMIHKIDPYYADNIVPDQAIIIKHNALTKVVSAHCTDSEYNQLFGNIIDSEPDAELAKAFFQNQSEFNDFESYSASDLEDVEQNNNVIAYLDDNAQYIIEPFLEEGLNKDQFVNEAWDHCVRLHDGINEEIEWTENQFKSTARIFFENNKEKLGI